VDRGRLGPSTTLLPALLSPLRPVSVVGSCSVRVGPHQVVGDLEGGPGGPQPTLGFQKAPDFNIVVCIVAMLQYITARFLFLMTHLSHTL
jgi:hypothetical protein